MPRLSETWRADGPDAVNILQRLMPEQMQAEAAGRLEKIAEIQGKLREQQVLDRTKELAARPPQSAASKLAQMLNRGAPEEDAPTYGAYQQLVNAAGPGINPAEVRGDDPALLQAVQGMSKAQRESLAEAQAQLEPRGPKGVIRGIELEYNRRLAADGIEGHLARGGTLAAIGGGAVAGGMALTEGAQQLIALMQYMQSGQANEERAASSPLA